MHQITKLLSFSVLAVSISACTGITEITSSTSSTVDAVTPDVTVNEFVSKRYVAIRTEAARGHGENLDALAQLMGQKDKEKFSREIKENFENIFAAETSNPDVIIAKIEAQLTNKS